MHLQYYKHESYGAFALLFPNLLSFSYVAHVSTRQYLFSVLITGYSKAASSATKRQNITLQFTDTQ